MPKITDRNEVKSQAYRGGEEALVLTPDNQLATVPLESTRSDVKNFKTKADLLAFGQPEAGVIARVWDDTEIENNGTYYWKQFTWVREVSGQDYVEKSKLDTLRHITEMNAISASAIAGKNGPLIGWTIKPGSTGFEIDITGGVDVDGDRSNLLDSTITVQAGDKYVYYDVANGCASYTTEQPDKILLAKLGYVYNPYEPERHRTIEGIPSDWDTKLRHSWIWKSPAVDDADARLALYRFHNGLEDIAYPNDPRRGCSIDTSLLRDHQYIDSINAARDDTYSRIIVGDCGDTFFGVDVTNYKIELNGGSNPLLIDQCRVLFNESAEALPYSLFSEKGGATGFPSVTLMNSTFKNARSGLLGLNKVANMGLVKNVLLSTAEGDGIKPGDNIEFDLVEIYDTARGEGSHSDGYQWTGSPTDGVMGFNKINRNCIWMPSNNSINTMDTIGANNACLYFDPDWGPNSGEVAITEIHADRCFLNGGGFTFYVICESGGGYLARDIKLTNSWFGLDYGFGFARDIAVADSQYSQNGDGISVWENNRRIDSGELIPKPNVS